jgi:hypothetical protein
MLEIMVALIFIYLLENGESCMIKIEQWSIQAVMEGGLIGCLNGCVYGHPEFDDETEISSSILIAIDIPNCTARTISGSQYYLGIPDQNWVDWLMENGYVETVKQIGQCLNKLSN